MEQWETKRRAEKAENTTGVEETLTEVRNGKGNGAACQPRAGTALEGLVYVGEDTTEEEALQKRYKYKRIKRGQGNNNFRFPQWLQ